MLPLSLFSFLPSSRTSYLGGDHFLATLFNPLKLALVAALAVALGGALAAHRVGLAPRPLSALLDAALPVLTLGVFNGVSWAGRRRRHAFDRYSSLLRGDVRTTR